MLVGWFQICVDSESSLHAVQVPCENSPFRAVVLQEGSGFQHVLPKMSSVICSHKKKRMREIKKLISRGVYDKDGENPFDLFVSSTEIRWCYYKDSKNILGQTYGMLVLQDFESITANLLCRTIETVEGGGIITILLKNMTSLKQFYSMVMDCHAKYRTESHNDIVPRFNERFILSLSNCQTCMVLDVCFSSFLFSPFAI